MKEKLLTTKNVVLMGMFGALAGVLMLFEFPLPFLAPSFYGLDVSEGSGPDRYLCHGASGWSHYGSGQDSGEAGIKANQYRICG